MWVKDKNAIVVGMGKSGLSSARLLKSLGAKVKVLELKPEEQVLGSVQELKEMGIEFKTGGYELKDFRSADLVVLSPGVNEREEIYQTLLKKGVEVIGELEFASRFITAEVIAVTGTDGKTTTVSLLGKIFKGRYSDRVWVGGNIGKPLAELVLSGHKPEVVILEVSSFQLAQAKTFHPKIALMLNIARDHLDRHLDFEDYYQAKLKLFMNQTEKDLAVLNYEDPWVKRVSESIKARVIWFGEEVGEGEGARLLGQEMIYRNSTREFKISVSNWRLRGKHNLKNLLGAIAVAGSYGIEPSLIQEAVDSFKAPSHRLEFVEEINGVKYYDDSKGTTPHAVLAALQSFSDPIILLLGGRNKGIDFSELAREIQVRVKAVICFGESRYEIKTQLAGAGVRSVLAERMKDAVLLAKELARGGEVVLLSPGCTSFDEFRDYEERGEKFQELVRSLK